MNPDDYEACAELCDDRGFIRQAARLRAVARRGLLVFAVCERVPDDSEYGGFHHPGGVPVALFLGREDAEREPQGRELLAFRHRNLYEYCHKGHIEWESELNLSREEFERRISAILGPDYRLPDRTTHQGPLFPADATDEQIGAIARLFGHLYFYYVAELELFDGANPTAPAESPS